MAVNPIFFDEFGEQLANIDAWLWGHEHNLAAFDPYIGLERGRCIGSGAMPVELLWKPYETLDNLALPDGVDAPPVMHPNCRLGHDGDHYHHAFAMLETNGETGSMIYYQVPGVDGDAEEIFRENI